jgi:lysophospholipase L1-like esterase
VAQLERLVLPLAPRAIVLYAGDNDLDHGARPEQVQTLFEEFVAQVDDRLGLVPLVFISIKPSPLRLRNIAQIRRANALVRATIAAWPQARYLDVFSLMLEPDGQTPRPELYDADGLHLTAAGYQLWAAQVRSILSELGLLL